MRPKKILFFSKRCHIPLCIVSAIFSLILGIAFAEQITESFAHFTPDYPKIDLRPILKKEHLTSSDYHTLYMQTGLSKLAIEDIRIAVSPHSTRNSYTGISASPLSDSAPVSDAFIARILTFQENFFAPIRYSCKKRLLVTSQEFLIDEAGYDTYGFDLAPLKDGDILLTRSTHTLGWRNGHAGIVVDAKAGTTVEAVSLGSRSCYQTIRSWRKYTTLIVLRLKETSATPIADPAQGSATITLPDPTGVSHPYASHPAHLAARIAKDHLINLPYHLTVGLTRPKFQFPDEVQGTQCAHLVWLAYRAAGVDADANGGRFVTVKDIADSPLFEVVQIYGVDPENIWN